MTSKRAREEADDLADEQEIMAEEALANYGGGAPPEEEPIAEPDLGLPNSLMNGSEWTTLKMDTEYMPPIGAYSDPRTGLCNTPFRQTGSNGPNPILAFKAPCARGKSTAFRLFMEQGVFARDQNARVLLLSANIMYGTSLTAELASHFRKENVGFYRDVATETLPCYPIIVCSLESLHRIEGQRFDAILMDEVRTIARLVGGGTMADFKNVRLLRELCRSTPLLVACDADLDFKSNVSEPTSLVQDFFQFVVPERSVLKCELSHPGPMHLKRRANILFDFKSSEGKKVFFEQIKSACAAWHGDHTKRFAVCVGSKKQLIEVMDFARKECKVPTKPYSGDTDDGSKFVDLCDPDTAWQPFGCIVSTTSLSIGVDPKTIQFARVFMWTHRLGCNILQMLQAAHRFGRQKDTPLLDTTVPILADCIPPGVHQQLVATGKRKALVPPTYADSLHSLQQRRGSTARRYAAELLAAGGRPLGVSTRCPAVADTLLRTMAHGELERRQQCVDHFGALTNALNHHGWPYVLADVDRSDHRHEHSFENEDDVDVDADDEFACLGDTDKMLWALCDIMKRGEDIFWDDCFGLVGMRAKEVKNLSARDKALVNVYWLLKRIRRLPDGAHDEGGRKRAAEQLVEMDRVVGGDHRIIDALNLSAHLRVLSSTSIMRMDSARRNDPDAATHHPFLKTAVGTQMKIAEEFASLLGVEKLCSEFALVSTGALCGERCHESTLVDALRRKTLKTATPGDDALLKRMVELKNELKLCGRSDRPVEVVKVMSRAVGLECTVESTRPTAQDDGKRPPIVKSMTFKPILKDIVEDWLVWSPRLSRKVSVCDWQEKHDELDEEEGQVGLVDDPSMHHELFVYSADNRDTRTEKLDGNAVANELTRLRANTQRLGPREEKHLQWLEAADLNAQPMDQDGVRRLTVTYSKKSVIGRRMASYPSNQNCPSSLRPTVFGRFYRDVDMVCCHPKLMLQVAAIMHVSDNELPRLCELQDTTRTAADYGRDALYIRVAVYYGVAPKAAKFACLRVLNGGSITAWVNDLTGASRHDDRQPDLVELREEALLVRDAFYRVPEFQDAIKALTEEREAEKSGKVESAKADFANTTQGSAERVEAQKRLDNARYKATRGSIKQSVFSNCVFQKEDEVLTVLDEHLKSLGWTVASLQFDGLQVEHQTDRTLEVDMRGAEEAVLAKTGYVIELVEKELFHGTVAQ